MAPYKEPCSLRDLSIKYVSQLLQSACQEIVERYPRSKDQCFIEVNNLQEHLVNYIRPLLDEICQETFTNGDPMILRNAGGLLLGTFMHKHMKALSYRYDPTKNKTSFVWGLGVWEKYLQSVPNLVELDLSGVGYEINGILELLGNSNIKLEIITLIGYQVSENGLLNLSNMKTLREIRNFHAASLYLTRTGNDLPCVRILIQLLPVLEHIHCSCIGEALSELTYLPPLALRSCCEMQPTTPKIQAIARLCPNLVKLELGDPFVNQQQLDFRCLTDSDLSISWLKLVDFTFTADLNDFLVQKGRYLTALELVNFNDINLDKIKLIGHFCRGLEILRIYLDPDCRRLYRKVYNPSRYGYKDYRFNTNLFQNLLQFELEVYADEQNDETAMLMCLAHARDIQTITFRRQSRESYGVTDLLERILRDLFIWNPMLDLNALVLLGPFKLSVDTIKHVYELPKLTKLTLYIEYTHDVDVYLKTIEKEIEMNNLDLELSVWLSARQQNA